jgi:threonine 3-dehydrogenase
MRAVRKNTSTSGAELVEIAVPQPASDEILVKVKAASICGTDVNIYDWTSWAQGHISPPITIGHEVVGEVIHVPKDVDTYIRIGDLVSSETHIFCGKCYQCRIGNLHICENMQLFGIGRDGGFAEYATIPLRTAWKNDPSLPIEQMSVQEPLGNAVHVVQKAVVTGKTVAVYGLGPTGMCAVAVAKAYGAKKVIGINRSEYRRNLALAMGADEVYATLPDQYNGSIDVALEMSGGAEAIGHALSALRIAGTIIFFGIPKKEIAFDIGRYFINKELTAKSVFGRRIWETWYQTKDLLVAKKIDLAPMITHRFELEEFEEAMTVMKSGECGKIVLFP